MDRARHVVGFGLPVAIVIGLSGAGAFNPDTGAVLHSEALWRIFGIVGEGGMFLAMTVVIPLALVTVLRKLLTIVLSGRE
jgi:hypothetical protein